MPKVQCDGIGLFCVDAGQGDLAPLRPIHAGWCDHTALAPQKGSNGRAP